MGYICLLRTLPFRSSCSFFRYCKNGEWEQWKVHHDDIPEKYLTIQGKFSVSNATSAAAAPPISTDFATILQLLAHPRY